MATELRSDGNIIISVVESADGDTKVATFSLNPEICRLLKAQGVDTGEDNMFNISESFVNQKIEEKLLNELAAHDTYTVKGVATVWVDADGNEKILFDPSFKNKYIRKRRK